MESVDSNSTEANDFRLLFDNEKFYDRFSANKFIFNIFVKNKSLRTYKKEGKYFIGSNLIHIQCALTIVPFSYITINQNQRDPKSFNHF